MSDRTNTRPYSLRKRGGAASSPTGPSPTPVKVGTPNKPEAEDNIRPIGTDQTRTESTQSDESQPAKETDAVLSESTLSPAGESPGARDADGEGEAGVEGEGDRSHEVKSPLGRRKPRPNRPKREFSGDSSETEVDDDEQDDDYLEGITERRTRSGTKKKSPKQRRTSIDNTSPNNRHQPLTQQHPPPVPSPTRIRKQSPPPIHRRSHQADERASHLSHPTSTSSFHLPPLPVQPSPPIRRPPALKQLYYLPNLVKRAPQIIDHARREAAHNPDVQPECQRAVEAAINQLPDPQQRDSLCLILNRYSAFCASPYTAIDAFPLTPDKIFLFLARTLDHQIGRALLSNLPQPTTYPLPVMSHPGFPPEPSEGRVITRALVHCWIEALTYVQGSTNMLWPGLQEREGLLRDHLGTEELEGLVESTERWAAMAVRQAGGGILRGAPGPRVDGQPPSRTHSRMMVKLEGYDGCPRGPSYGPQDVPMSRPMRMSSGGVVRSLPPAPLDLQPGEYNHPSGLVPRLGSRPMMDGGWGPGHAESYGHGRPTLAPLHHPLPQHQVAPILPPIQVPTTQPLRPREPSTPHLPIQPTPTTSQLYSSERLVKSGRLDASVAEQEAALGGARELVRLASTEKAHVPGDVAATETYQSRVGEQPSPGTTSACDVLAIAAAAMAAQKRLGSADGGVAGEDRKPTPVIDPSLLEAASGLSSQARSTLLSAAAKVEAGYITEVAPSGQHLISAARTAGRSPAHPGLAAPKAAPPVLTRIQTDVQLSAPPSRHDTTELPMATPEMRPQSRSVSVVGRGEVAPVARKIRALPHGAGEYAGVEPMQGCGRPSPQMQQARVSGRGGEGRGYPSGVVEPEWCGDWYAPGPLGRAPPMSEYYLASRYQPSLPGLGARGPYGRESAAMGGAGRGLGAYSSQQIAEQLYRRSPAVDVGPYPPHAYSPPMSVAPPGGYGAQPAYHVPPYMSQSYDSYPPPPPQHDQHGASMPLPSRRLPLPPPPPSQWVQSGSGYDGGGYGPPLPGSVGSQGVGGHGRMASGGLVESVVSGMLGGLAKMEEGSQELNGGQGGPHAPGGGLRPMAGYKREGTSMLNGGGGGGAAGSARGGSGHWDGEGGARLGAGEGLNGLNGVGSE